MKEVNINMAKKQPKNNKQDIINKEVKKEIEKYRGTQYTLTFDDEQGHWVFTKIYRGHSVPVDGDDLVQSALVSLQIMSVNTGVPLEMLVKQVLTGLETWETKK